MTLHTKSFRQGRWPIRQRTRRVGLDAAFAKAIARSEFGRFYTDEQQQREVRRSLARAKAPRKPVESRSREPAEKAKADPPLARAEGATKPKLWHEPRVRERRTELANARAELLAAAKLRETKEQSQAEEPQP